GVTGGKPHREGNEVGRQGRPGSGALPSTAEAGELVPREPGGGKGAPRRGAVAGQQRGGIEPRSTVHETTTGSAAHVSPRRDEPDALIGHVSGSVGGGGGNPAADPAHLMSQATIPDVSEGSRSCFAGPGFPNRLHDFFDRGLEIEKSLFGHCPTVHLDAEFTALAVHHFHFDSRFLPQSIRHTGGMFSGTASDRAF